jgi:hypothetical protein
MGVSRQVSAFPLLPQKSEREFGMAWAGIDYSNHGPFQPRFHVAHGSFNRHRMPEDPGTRP